MIQNTNSLEFSILEHSFNIKSPGAIHIADFFPLKMFFHEDVEKKNYFVKIKAPPCVYFIAPT